MKALASLVDNPDLHSLSTEDLREPLTFFLVSYKDMQMFKQHTLSLGKNFPSLSPMKLLAVGTILLLLAGLLGMEAVRVFAATPQPYTQLPNSVLPQTTTDHLVGNHDANAQLTIELVLHPNNQAALDSLIASLYDPQSSQYHHWLATGAFASRFGPTASQLSAVTSFLKQAGLQVVNGSPSVFLLYATGKTGQIEAAFHTSIKDYQASNGTRYYANSTSVQIPNSLNGVIDSVIGLENGVKAHPNYIKPSTTSGQKPHFGGGPNGSGLTPSQIAGIYLANPVYSAGDTGGGKTLAVFELASYTASDISVYETQFGLPNVPLTNINVDGGPTSNSGAGEVELDIELQIALAPGTKGILVYNAPNSSPGVADEYAKIASDNTADAISTSWGLCEGFNDVNVRDSEFTSFEQMATQGQSIYAASGDSGAFDCLNEGNGSNQVDDPASQIYMTGVGGTSLGVDPGSNPNPVYVNGEESVWNNGCTSSSCNGAGGGGVSRIWARPKYQTGPGVVSAYSKSSPWCTQPAGTACREVPDVSLNADPQTGYAIFCTDSDCGGTFFGGWLQFGGTSCAAPLWAAITDLTDSFHNNRLGEPSFSLYKFDTSNGYAFQFHDVTAGRNGWFPATSNYDMATGIGTPKIYYLVTKLP
jgi:subtilase family serine protease